ncbi:MAG: deoxyguanosinetriphosphate triphosphohydrolase [Bdellovibrionales bacterium]|nr:deoxyguanosinetriphosphate triphosphohydrolase [Bdellovibrionales bacterium]
MDFLERRYEIEKQILAPYASHASQSRGRKIPEPESSNRTCFQRDRDRVLHSTAFRRMEYKTQVFVNHEGDHYRTRLTHTLEVAQIARTVSRMLQLNEDYTEALVLAHDLGHTPFGHAGEIEMSELMLEFGGFEHNKQSLRIVDVLEHPYPHFQGLNLSFEVREGIIKHSAHWRKENVPQDLAPSEQPALEAQLIDFVDEIAYNNHDIDDGLASGMFSFEQLQDVTLWKEAQTRIKDRFKESYDEKGLKRMTISALISILVEDLLATTTKNITDHRIKTLDDIRNLDKPLASYSESITKKNRELKSFLRENLYDHYRVIRMEVKARRIIRDLFKTYMSRPQQLPHKFADRHKDQDKPRVICDYIAGMTDRFATEEHSKLFDPSVRV